MVGLWLGREELLVRYEALQHSAQGLEFDFSLSQVVGKSGGNGRVYGYGNSLLEGGVHDGRSGTCRWEGVEEMGGR